MGDALRTYDTTFCGTYAGQWWADFQLWETVLNAHPEVKGLAELGTYKGGMSHFLYTQCRIRGIAFMSYDIERPDEILFPWAELDVLANPEQVRLDPKPFLLFCDAGNKILEVQVHGPRLAEGDLLAVHNWNEEIGPGKAKAYGPKGSKDVPDCLEMVHADWCFGSPTRFFRRV